MAQEPEQTEAEPLSGLEACPLCGYRTGFRYVGAKPSPRMPQSATVKVWQCMKCLGFLTPDYIGARGRFQQYLG
jgi:hypothetical protein